MGPKLVESVTCARRPRSRPHAPTRNSSVAASPAMPNTDKIKAARTGGDMKYKQKVAAISHAGRAEHKQNKKTNGHIEQLRRFEDAGHGVSTGRQYEHEENMAAQKARREAKAKKAADFKASLEASLADYGDADDADDADDAGPSLRFAMGARVECCVGPNEWLAGTVVALHYREPSWPRGRVAPYQVRLDEDGSLIFAPSDEDDVVRAAAPPEPAADEVRRRGGGDAAGEEVVVATYLY